MFQHQCFGRNTVCVNHLLSATFFARILQISRITFKLRRRGVNLNKIYSSLGHSNDNERTFSKLDHCIYKIMIIYISIRYFSFAISVKISKFQIFFLLFYNTEMLHFYAVCINHVLSKAFQFDISYSNFTVLSDKI